MSLIRKKFIASTPRRMGQGSFSYAIRMHPDGRLEIWDLQWPGEDLDADSVFYHHCFQTRFSAMLQAARLRGQTTPEERQADWSAIMGPTKQDAAIAVLEHMGYIWDGNLWVRPLRRR